MDRDEIRRIVQEELRSLLGIAAAPTSEPEYLPLSEAWQKLGYRNYRQMWSKIKSGLLRVGYEIQDRRSPGASDPEYWCHMERCRTRLNTLPAKRRA